MHVPNGCVLAGPYFGATYKQFYQRHNEKYSVHYLSQTMYVPCKQNNLIHNSKKNLMIKEKPNDKALKHQLHTR